MSGLPALRAHEEALLAGHADVAELHADAVKAGRAEISALIAEHDSAGDDVEAFATQVDETQRRALFAYAQLVDGRLPDNDVADWRRQVSALRSGSIRTMLSDSAPGGALLLDALEPVPQSAPIEADLDRALAERADLCQCGYATTRVIPRRICVPCGMCISGAWVAEEERLLARLPALASDQSVIFDDLVEDIALRRLAPEQGISGVERARRRKAARQIRRTNAAHRDQIALVDTARWEELAALAARDSRPLYQADAKRGKRLGLGTARLSQIALASSDEIKARMTQKARAR